MVKVVSKSNGTRQQYGNSERGAEQLQLVQAQFLVELDFIKFPPLLNSVCFRGIFARLTALADTCHVVHHIPVGLIYCIQFWSKNTTKIISIYAAIVPLLRRNMKKTSVYHPLPLPLRTHPVFPTDSENHATHLPLPVVIYELKCLPSTPHSPRRTIQVLNCTNLPNPC